MGYKLLGYVVWRLVRGPRRRTHRRKFLIVGIVGLAIGVAIGVAVPAQRQAAGD